jgi:hypothetical protein
MERNFVYEYNETYDKRVLHFKITLTEMTIGGTKSSLFQDASVPKSRSTSAFVWKKGLHLFKTQFLYKLKSNNPQFVLKYDERVLHFKITLTEMT